MRIGDRQFSHTVPAEGCRSPSGALPSTWDLKSGHRKTSSIIHAQLLQENTMVLGREHVYGVTPRHSERLSSLEGHHALHSLLGHHICFQGLSNEIYVFKDHQGRICPAFSNTSAEFCSALRGEQPSSSLPRHPCYENDTPPVTLFTPTVAVNFISTLTFSSCTVTHDHPRCSV